MTRVRKLTACSLLVLITALPIGCRSSDSNTPPSRGSAVDSGDVKLEMVPSNFVDIVQPTVEIAQGTMTIAGSVRRKTGVSQLFAGRIDIEFVDTDGEILDSLPAPLTPKKIPTDRQLPSVFHTEYDYTPPKGSTVRLRFVDSETADREDLAGTTLETGHINTSNAGARSGTVGARR